MNRSLLTKFFIVSAVTCVILIALFAINSIIDSRQGYRDEAVQSIAESYAGPQTFVGPVLVQPYTQVTQRTEVLQDGKSRTVTDTRDASKVTFPTRLTLHGTLTPSERHHGLYRAAVYVLDTEAEGSFDAPDPEVEGTVTYGEPYLALQLSDVRGIIGSPLVQVNGQALRMTQGGAIQGTLEELAAEPATAGLLRGMSSPAMSMLVPKDAKPWQSNLRVRLVGAQRGRAAHYDFKLAMQIAGTQRLTIGPVADLNQISLDSTWPSPLFAGQFLPRTPQVGPGGFKAAWSLSSLAAATQQQIATGAETVDTLNVSLLTPIDPYKLSDRATKYGVLFIVLTFGGFFLFEMMKQIPIHPVQYLLVGFGLAIFFLLLISFSEHMRFGLAYTIASAACIFLLTFYLSFVLRSPARGVTFGAMLTALYGAMYGLLISEDNALVLGSLLLFAVLAAVMIVTRRVDWYRNGDSRVAPPPAVETMTPGSVPVGPGALTPTPAASTAASAGAAFGRILD